MEKGVLSMDEKRKASAGGKKLYLLNKQRQNLGKNIKKAN